MHGDSPEHVATKIADMSARREKFGLGRMQFGVAGYAFTRKSDSEVAKELERITDVKQNAKGYANYQQWLQGTQLEQKMSIQEYSVSNRGLRSGLVGTPAQVQDQIGKFAEVGVDLLLLQFSPQLEEMEIFSDSVIRVGAAKP
jgi:FMNH2-dependent dimethyl sulfone monooxygenase